LEAIELYFSPTLAFKPHQVHVSEMKLAIMKSEGVVQLEKTFKGYEGTYLNEVVTSPTGKKYENRYRMIPDAWSYSNNEIKVDITVSKFTCM